MPEAELRAALAAGAGPEDTARALLALADGRGGPDDASCVVADVLPSGRAA